jgi:hypothetical protein
MWKIIKLFGGKVLKTRAGGFISSLFGGWQLYVLVGALFGGYILLLKNDIRVAVKNLNKETEKLVELEIKLAEKDLDLKTCQKVNNKARLEVVHASNLANQCTSLFEKSKANNDSAIKKMKQREKAYEKQINDIKKIKPETDCDMEPLNDADAKWLQGKDRPDSTA